MWATDGYLNENGVINTKRLQVILDEMADWEKEVFEKEYADINWYKGKQAKHGKEMEISQVQTQFRELSSKFEAVQLELLKEKDIAATFQTELRRERDIAAAEREREMLALEDRMIRRIQASLALILAVML